MNGLIKTNPNKEKAKSITRMARKTLEMIENIDMRKFPSNVLKEYYEILRELASVLMLLDGYKAQGEGAHKQVIDYIEKNFSEFSEYEIQLMHELRMTRNRIAYDGFFIREEYLKRKREDIKEIIGRLLNMIEARLAE